MTVTLDNPLFRVRRDAFPAGIEGERMYRELEELTRALAEFQRQVVSLGIRNEPLNADPADPLSGEFVIWQSNGTGTGADGDVYIKSTNTSGTTSTPVKIN
jgi:hypothetical protein